MTGFAVASVMGRAHWRVVDGEEMLSFNPIMQRIAILGCPGGGKSTLAQALGARLGLPVVHIDSLYWQPGWTAPDEAAFRARMVEALAGERWVVDGNFSATFDLRLPKADTVIVIEQPRGRCLWGALRRWLSWRGRNRPDLAPGCPEKLDPEFYRYIWNYAHDQQPKLAPALARYCPDIVPVRLRSDRQIDAFLADLEGEA